MSDRYLIQAFDANGDILDMTTTGEGESYYVSSAGELLDMVKTRKSAVLHDHDRETDTKKRIAYFAIAQVSNHNRLYHTTDELFITKWGRHCKVETRAIERETHWNGSRRQAPWHINNV